MSSPYLPDGCDEDLMEGIDRYAEKDDPDDAYEWAREEQDGDDNERSAA